MPNRALCRLPRILKFTEAQNLRLFEFEEYVATLAEQERRSFLMAVTAMKTLLLRTLVPKRVAGLGGLFQCGDCGEVGADLTGIRHRNCLWWALS